MSARIPPGSKDNASARRLLDLAIDIAGNQSALADVIGVDRTTVASYVGGRRQIEWHVLFGALERLLRDHPEHAPKVAGVVMGEMLDQHGVWLPRIDAEDLGDVSEEGQDVLIAQGKAAQAVRTGDAKALNEAAQDIVRETIEYATVLQMHGSGR
jgi:hypothetical protein